MRQRIGTRLIGSFIVSAVITILVAGIAMFAIVKVNNSLKYIINADLQVLEHAHRFTNDLTTAFRYEREFLSFNEAGNLAKQEEYSAKLENTWKALAYQAENVQQTSRLCLECHEDARLAPVHIKDIIEKRGNQLASLVSLNWERQQELTALMLAGKTYEQIQPRYLEYRESTQQLEDLMMELHEDTVHMMEIRQQGLIQLQTSVRSLVIATVVAAVIAALLLGITLTRSITRPVSRLSEVTKKIAAGDLTQRAKVTSRDELGELAISFNQMTESLQKSKHELQEKNEQLDVQNEELRATEDELRASNEELQAANEELREAQEQLVRSERLAAIGQLAGGVGHELRNPLGAIKNAVYYVRRKVAKSELGQEEPRVMQFLDIMDDEINSSNKIINDLLGFSRVGKPVVSPASIEKVIDDALSHTTVPENIELTKKMNAELPEVEIDTDQIRQVLINIITNAVQAMPDGGKLTISASEKEKFLEAEIADTGCGIPQEVIDKIFDPLFTTRAKGIGLGLAVCKAIIERHEGQIEVESEAGKGTTFIIRLPLKAER